MERNIVSTFPVNAIRRSRSGRLHGHTCFACGSAFDAVYGKDVADGDAGFHPVASPPGQQELPAALTAELVPVCANDHRMLPRRCYRPLTVKEQGKKVVHNRCK